MLIMIPNVNTKDLPAQSYSSSNFSQAGYPVVTIESVCSAGGCSSTLNQTWFVTEGETNGEQRYLPILKFYAPEAHIMYLTVVS